VWSGAHTLAPSPLFFSAVLLFRSFPKWAGLFFAPLFFQRILYAFMSASDLSVRFAWHYLISMISDNIARFDIKDIMYCNRLNGIYYHFFCLFDRNIPS